MNKSLVTVKVKGGNIGRALKLFKKLVRESNHIQELKDRKYYIKPKTKRRLIKQQAIRENEKLLKELRREDKHQ